VRRSGEVEAERSRWISCGAIKGEKKIHQRLAAAPEERRGR